MPARHARARSSIGRSHGSTHSSQKPTSGLSRFRYIVNGAASGVKRTGPITRGLWKPGSQWSISAIASATNTACPATRTAAWRRGATAYAAAARSAIGASAPRPTLAARSFGNQTAASAATKRAAHGAASQKVLPDMNRTTNDLMKGRTS